MVTDTGNWNEPLRATKLSFGETLEGELQGRHDSTIPLSLKPNTTLVGCNSLKRRKQQLLRAEIDDLSANLALLENDTAQCQAARDKAEAKVEAAAADVKSEKEQLKVVTRHARMLVRQATEASGTQRSPPSDLA